MRALGLAAVLGAGTVPALGASFGVPSGGPGGGATDGYFVLVGEDADPANNAFGDITNELTLYIEVTGTTLDLCVHDPGIWSAARSQLDFTFNSATPYSAFMDYALYPPGSTIPIAEDSTTWGADTAPSDGACWRLYNGPVTPGLYRFVARMPDGPGVDQDVNLFGVETSPDYNAWAHYATVGHSTWTGAGLATGAIKLYPWIATASRGLDASREEVCGLDLVTWDLDGATAGVRPPDVTLRTRLNWTDTMPPSLDGTFRLDHWPNLAPLNASDDVGIFALEFSRLALADGVIEANWPTAPPGFDFNAFSVQVWDFGNLEPFDFTEYPIVPPDPRMATRNSRRIYLPLRGGAAPDKEWLGHRILNPPASGDYDRGVAAAVDVELRMTNPTGYTLTGLSARTVLNPAAEVSDPRNVTAAGGTGASASATGKTIDWTVASLAAGQSATVTYTVDFLPAATGFFFLTGDGSDFVGGASPTTATWNTPFAAGESARPCAIETRVRTAPCGVTADAAAPTTACLGEDIALDGSGTTAISCSGPIEYRWTGPGITAPAFSTSPLRTVSGAPAGANSYTLEARCQGTPGCDDFDAVTVTVSGEPRAPANAGADRSAATCDVPFRIGTPGDPTRYTYAWSPPALVSDPTLPEPDFVQAAAGSYALTLRVTPIAAPGCAATDALQVDIVSGTPSGSLGNRLRAAERVNDVELTWPLGFVSPDRYNLHRTSRKTELDKTAYAAPVLNPTTLITGTYLDLGAMAGPPDLHLYEVWGRDCAGNSVIQ